MRTARVTEAGNVIPLIVATFYSPRMRESSRQMTMNRDIEEFGCLPREPEETSLTRKSGLAEDAGKNNSRKAEIADEVKSFIGGWSMQPHPPHKIALRYGIHVSNALWNAVIAINDLGLNNVVPVIQARGTELATFDTKVFPSGVMSIGSLDNDFSIGLPAGRWARSTEHVVTDRQLASLAKSLSQACSDRVQFENVLGNLRVGIESLDVIRHEVRNRFILVGLLSFYTYLAQGSYVTFTLNDLECKVFSSLVAAQNNDNVGAFTGESIEQEISSLIAAKIASLSFPMVALACMMNENALFLRFDWSPYPKSDGDTQNFTACIESNPTLKKAFQRELELRKDSSRRMADYLSELSFAQNGLVGISRANADAPAYDLQGHEFESERTVNGGLASGSSFEMRTIDEVETVCAPGNARDGSSEISGEDKSSAPGDHMTNPLSANAGKVGTPRISIAAQEHPIPIEEPPQSHPPQSCTSMQVAAALFAAVTDQNTSNMNPAADVVALREKQDTEGGQIVRLHQTPEVSYLVEHDSLMKLAAADETNLAEITSGEHEFTRNLSNLSDDERNRLVISLVNKFMKDQDVIKLAQPRQLASPDPHLSAEAALALSKGIGGPVPEAGPKLKNGYASSPRALLASSDVKSVLPRAILMFCLRLCGIEAGGEDMSNGGPSSAVPSPIPMTIRDNCKTSDGGRAVENPHQCRSICPHTTATSPGYAADQTGEEAHIGDDRPLHPCTPPGSDRGSFCATHSSSGRTEKTTASLDWDDWYGYTLTPVKLDEGQEADWALDIPCASVRDGDDSCRLSSASCPVGGSSASCPVGGTSASCPVRRSSASCPVGRSSASGSVGRASPTCTCESCLRLLNVCNWVSSVTVVEANADDSQGNRENLTSPWGNSHVDYYQGRRHSCPSRLSDQVLGREDLNFSRHTDEHVAFDMERNNSQTTPSISMSRLTTLAQGETPVSVGHEESGTFRHISCSSLASENPTHSTLWSSGTRLCGDTTNHMAAVAAEGSLVNTNSDVSSEAGPSLRGGPPQRLPQRPLEKLQPSAEQAGTRTQTQSSPSKWSTATDELEKHTRDRSRALLSPRGRQFGTIRPGVHPFRWDHALPHYMTTEVLPAFYFDDRGLVPRTQEYSNLVVPDLPTLSSASPVHGQSVGNQRMLPPPYTGGVVGLRLASCRIRTSPDGLTIDLCPICLRTKFLNMQNTRTSVPYEFLEYTPYGGLCKCCTLSASILGLPDTLSSSVMQNTGAGLAQLSVDASVDCGVFHRFFHCPVRTACHDITG